MENKNKMIINAIDSHINMLYNSIINYQKSDNIEAIKDCYNEVKQYRLLKKDFQTNE